GAHAGVGRQLAAAELQLRRAARDPVCRTVARPARVPRGGRVMRRAAVVLLAWGAWLGVAAAVPAPFHPRVIEYGLLGGAAAATLVAGLVLWAFASRRPARRGWRAMSASSGARAALPGGLPRVLLGAGF